MTLKVHSTDQTAQRAARWHSATAETRAPRRPAFRRSGRKTGCAPGGFIVECGDEPSRFVFENRNDLHAMQETRPEPAEPMRGPDRPSARLFDGRDRPEAQPHRSIAAIGDRFGFSERPHFSRPFTSAFARTPAGNRARLAAQT